MTRGRLLPLLVVLAVVAGAALLLAGRDEPRPKAAAPAVPAPPAAASGAATYIESDVLPNGAIRVRHWIDSPRKVRQLKVRAADPDGLPGTLEARNILIGGDGEVVARRTDVGTKVQTIRLQQPARALYLSYTLFGAVSSDGTVSGRALARVTALDVDLPQALTGPTRRLVDGPVVVRNVACLPRGRQESARPCGRSVGDGAWQVELTGKRRLDRLIAQVDAPTEQ